MPEPWAPPTIHERSFTRGVTGCFVIGGRCCWIEAQVSEPEPQGFDLVCPPRQVLARLRLGNTGSEGGCRLPFRACLCLRGGDGRVLLALLRCTPAGLRFLCSWKVRV